MKVKTKKVVISDLNKGLLVGGGVVAALVWGGMIIRNKTVEPAAVNRVSTLSSYVCQLMKDYSKYPGKVTIEGVVSKEMATLDNRVMYFVTTTNGAKYAIDKLLFPYGGGAVAAGQRPSGAGRYGDDYAKAPIGIDVAILDPSENEREGTSTKEIDNFRACGGDINKDDVTLSKYLGKTVTLTDALAVARVPSSTPKPTATPGYGRNYGKRPTTTANTAAEPDTMTPPYFLVTVKASAITVVE